jgi:hypothetical protein
MGADNSRKTPVAQSLGAWRLAQGKQDQGRQGQALPASVVAVDGSIVTVAILIMPTVGQPAFTFPQITCPLFGPEWIRYPIQADPTPGMGTLGFLVPADYYLGGVSGLGGGTADLSQPANLSALAFFPIGNKNWPAPIDPDALEFYGHPNVIIRDGQDKYRITVTPSGIEIDLHASGSLKITGLPTSSPGGSDEVWNNAGSLEIT